MIRLLLVTGTSDLAARTAAALKNDASMQLIGVTENGEEALAMAIGLRPDVVAIELRLPNGDSVETVKEIMIATPRPVVAIFGRDGVQMGAVSERALEAGALAVIAAPDLAANPAENDSIEKFLSTIRGMAQVKVVRHRRKKRKAEPGLEKSPDDLERPVSIIGIAASTGGPTALRVILRTIPAEFPAPILIVQHMSDGFIEATAAHLDAAVALTVKIAADGERLRPGFVYLAPDSRQLGVFGKTRIRVADDAPVSGFRPSASYLFRSISGNFKKEALAIVLTGMGDDGILGLMDLRRQGGRVIAQDESTSAVFGMPKAAILAGLADFILPLEAIADRMIALTSPARPELGRR